MKSIRQWLREGLLVARLAAGWIIYLVSGKTPAFAHQSMINLFCLTGGHSNDLLSRAIAFVEHPYQFSNASGVLGNMLEKEQRGPVISALRERGYYVFDRRLPEDLCDRLLEFATSHPCNTRRMDGNRLGKPFTMSYRRGAPQAVRYDFDTRDLLDNRDIQKLLSDLSFAAVAQDYFGCRPVVDVLGMWWHTDFSDKPDSEAAQYYHFDMDRPKWLKFFIYLTDVESTSGPHSFVAGSHKSRGIPSSLLRKGYARLTDEEVSREFSGKDIIEFTAPRGTILGEDTRGLHKGKHVQKGDRLMLQIQFSNSLFGGFYPKVSMGGDLSSDLKHRVEQFPGLYAAYLP